jgi:hypothetical protein
MRIAMMAMTTRSSMRVNPVREGRAEETGGIKDSPERKVWERGQSDPQAVSVPLMEAKSNRSPGHLIDSGAMECSQDRATSMRGGEIPEPWWKEGARRNRAVFEAIHAEGGASCRYATRPRVGRATRREFRVILVSPCRIHQMQIPGARGKRRELRDVPYTLGLALTPALSQKTGRGGRRWDGAILGEAGRTWSCLSEGLESMLLLNASWGSGRFGRVPAVRQPAILKRVFLEEIVGNVRLSGSFPIGANV